MVIAWDLKVSDYASPAELTVTMIVTTKVPKPKPVHNLYQSLFEEGVEREIKLPGSQLDPEEAARCWQRFAINYEAVEFTGFDDATPDNTFHDVVAVGKTDEGLTRWVYTAVSRRQINRLFELIPEVKP